MTVYIADIIPKIQQFSEKLDNLTLLTNQHWVLIDELIGQKHVYIFRSNHELLISTDGKVQKARWEYLGNNSILIDKNDESFLFKHGFFDNNVLALKRDNSIGYTLFANENKFNGELNSTQKVIEFLAIEYLIESERNLIELHTGLKFPTPSIKIKNDEDDSAILVWVMVLIAASAIMLAVLRGIEIS